MSREYQLAEVVVNEATEYEYQIAESYIDETQVAAPGGFQAAWASRANQIVQVTM